MSLADSETIGHAFDVLLGESVNGSEGLAFSQRYMAGVLMANDYAPFSVTGSEGFFSSIGKGIKAVWDWIVKTLKAIWDFITGKKSKTKDPDFDSLMNEALKDLSVEQVRESAVVGKKYIKIVNKVLDKFRKNKERLSEQEDAFKNLKSEHERDIKQAYEAAKKTIDDFIKSQETNLSNIEKIVNKFDVGEVNVNLLKEYSGVLEKTFLKTRDQALASLKNTQLKVNPLVKKMENSPGLKSGQNIDSEEKILVGELKNLTVCLADTLAAIAVFDDEFKAVVQENAEYIKENSNSN